MQRIILYFLILNCFVKLNNSFAQSLNFEQFTSKDGILSDDVFNLHQDKDGYIWLFTNYGSMKYNGKNFSKVFKNLPFSESFVYCFYENKSGKKWFANSNSKIYEVRNDSAIIISGIENVSRKLRENVSEIFQLYVDDSLNIFACTKGNSYKFIYSKNYLPRKLNNDISTDSILHNAIEKEKDILSVINYAGRSISGFFSKRKYLNLRYVFDNKKDTVYAVKCQVNSAPKTFKKFGNDTYFSFYDKLVKIGNRKQLKYLHLNSIILNFTKDKNDHLWVACYNNGLIELDENDSIVNHYFKNITINDVLCDSQNGLWVSSSGFGVFHCKYLNEFQYLNDSLSKLPFNYIKLLNNKIVISNNLGEVFLYENSLCKKIGSTKNIQEELTDISEIKDFYIASSRQNTILISKINNLARPLLINKTEKIFPSHKSKTLNNDTVVLIKRTDIFWVTKNKIIKHITTKYKLYDIEIINNLVFLATENGVFILSNNSFSRPSYLIKTENCLVTKIVKDEFKELWFCTTGSGLFELTNNNTLRHFNMSSGLPSDIVNDINILSNKTILISTNKGLFRSSKYSKWDVLYTGQVLTAFEIKNEIYLLTKDGLVILKNSNTPLIYPINLNISEIYVNGNLSNETLLNNLKFNQNNIVVNFDIISYSSSIPNIIYNLKGKKNYTSIVTNQQIVFQNLPPGSYTLTASLVANNSKSNSITIPFAILPVFWQTTWFKVLSGIVGLTCCCLIGWESFRYFRLKEDKKNKANLLITEYKLIALKAQVNPHFMSNCLTAIQYLILSNKFQEAIQYLAKFSFLVRQVLDFSTKKNVTLKEELLIIELNIELEQLRFDEKIEFLIEYSDEIDIEKIFIPPLLLQPLIENAIWHGLLPIKGWKKNILSIKIVKRDNLLYLIIEDNGVGRINNIKNIGNLKESKGIEITKQRISNLNTLYNVNSGRLEIEDLFDHEQKNIGTRAIVILPIIIDFKDE